MEFKGPLDVTIAEKMLTFPLLGEEVTDKWNFQLTREFDMTNDSHLFMNKPANDRLPLYEGKMIHQFTHQWENALRFWIRERAGRKAILGRGVSDVGQTLGYEKYRLGIRAIGRTTDSRTLIVGPIPKNVFCGNSILALDRDLQRTRDFTDAE